MFNLKSNIMRQFHIHHSTGKDRFTEVKEQPREYAGYVEADSLQDAFIKSQNCLDGSLVDWNKTNPCRSTSVGDVIQDGDDFYLVKNFGFEPLLESPVVTNPISDQEQLERDMMVAQNVVDNFRLHGDMANQFNDSQKDGNDYEHSL